MNELASSREPFLFITDFKNEKNHVLTLPEIDSNTLLYDVNGISNVTHAKVKDDFSGLTASPLSYEEYLSSYNKIHREIELGNTYLTNLTFPTPVSISSSLHSIFHESKAKYKLWLNDECVVFSPEIFVRIEAGQLSSYPMKGTIDASIPGAREMILASEKEMAEHTTIVDLIRNDMSLVSSNVRVDEFRYVDEIKTSHKHLLQVSSKISGELPDDYLDRLGNIVFSLLPAGSICGAPKAKTLEIIESIEDYDRGYYTGVIGYFDGVNFDSGVMIRYIEQQQHELVYKSGGGIHYLSDPKKEYQELIDKVYVPVS